MSHSKPDAAKFHRSANCLLDEAMVHVRYRVDHEAEWLRIRLERMPQHLLEIRAEREAAGRELDGLRYLIAEAKTQDRWFGEFGDRLAAAQQQAVDSSEPLRQSMLSELEQHLPAAESRLRRAEGAMATTRAEWHDAEHRLEMAWLAEREKAINAAIADFRRLFQKHRHQLGGITNTADAPLGKLRVQATSACHALLLFAESIAKRRQVVFPGLEPGYLRSAVEAEAGWLARSLSEASRVARRPAIGVHKAIDDAGYDLLSTAWDETDPTHRQRPTWQQLAEAVHSQLALASSVKSTLTALKQRSARTRAKWEAIQRELDERKMERTRRLRK
ncbi:MAG: hypothetical protein JNK49_21625 [Planctomycetes bacterium]|nr:hypothetical protein [Planctomycetota bacterium]